MATFRILPRALVWVRGLVLAHYLTIVTRKHFSEGVTSGSSHQRKADYSLSRKTSHELHQWPV
jgi:hypothetical protein